MNKNKPNETKIVVLGGLGEVGKNMYCIMHKDAIVIIDAGVSFPESELMGVDYVLPDFTFLKENEDKIKALLITHGHEDHIGGIPFLLQSINIPAIYAPNHAKELISVKLQDKNISLTDYVGVEDVHLDPDSIVDDGDKIHIGNIEFKVIHTPGHTKGGSSLYCEQEKLVFSGDTLFHGTWGRTDLPTSNFMDIMNSITEKILKLPDDTIVYPRTW